MITETLSSDDSGVLSNKGAQSIRHDDTAGIRHGAHAMRARVRQARESARRASNGTANYIKNEPGKAMLIAFALGAALVAVLRLMPRWGGED
jgi:ElaB/YqjD/DUF883 family membrane-anchored ribosome-binding protein